MNGATGGAKQYVDWIQLTQMATDLSNYANGSIMGQITKIRDLENQMDWTGTAAESALQSYNSFLSKMENLAKAVDKYAKFLGKAAEQAKETDQRIASVFQNKMG